MAYQDLLVMESIVTTLAKNLTTWSRRATVQATDTLVNVSSSVRGNADVWLSKARIVLSDSAGVAWQGLRSRFRT